MRSNISLPNPLLRQLAEIYAVFKKSRVVWAIFAGVAVSIYGAQRPINDLDIIIRERDLQKASSSLYVQAINFENKFQSVTIRTQLIRFRDCEIATRLLLETTMGKCEFALDDSMIRRRRWVTLDGIRVPVLSPEDNIVFKAILQRGSEHKKHDLEDIKDILANQEINKDYLKKRIKMCQSEERVSKVLKQFLPS